MGCAIDKDPEIYRDVPISLQLVGRKYEDEKVCLFCCLFVTSSVADGEAGT